MTNLKRRNPNKDYTEKDTLKNDSAEYAKSDSRKGQF